jgi:diguanylate cyclase (GGDEF)-like protein
MKTSELNDFNKTAIIDDDTDIKPSSGYPYLVIFIGKDSGRRHRLKQGSMTIGRSSRADITIEDDRISRIHCAIEWLGDNITIQDKASTNGIYVNSQKVDHAALSPGVPLQIGHSIMKIEYKDEAEIKAEKNLLRRASIDVLTGTFNREHFFNLASMEIAYALRQQLTVGIIMIDIDNFKQVNDKYGHQMGDYVLKWFANIVIENKRTEDLFARYGGEEFIIMPRGELRKEDLYILCERIRKAVKNFEFCFDEACVRITISLGFHLMKVEGSDVDKILNDLIRKADQALYLAKDRGRNRTENLL